MKIAVIGQKRVPSREGGIEKTVEKQMLKLARKGHEAVFFNRSGHNIFGAEYDSSADAVENISCRKVYTPKGFAGVPVYSFLATVKALRAHCDILYYHGSGSCVMIPFARLFGAKCAAMLHGIDSQREKWGRFGRLYLKKGEKAAAKHSDACFVLSENMQDYIRETYGTDTIRIFNGAEPPVCSEKAAAELMERFGLEKDGYILTLVRIVPEKGLHYLIRAFRECRTDKNLVIAGGEDPACKKYCEELKELAAGDERILFTGYIEEPYVSSLYLNAYLFVLPSTLEGMAHSLLEALAAGCCCLTSDIPENRDVVGEHGICFRNRDADDLRDKLQALLDDPKTVDRLRAGASEYVLDCFSWDACAAMVEDVFEKII